MRFEFLTRANVSALHTLCTSDNPEFASANAKREEWLNEMFRKGLRGWIAFQDRQPIGYVEYLPVEAAPYPIVGQNANFLTCLWVLPQFKRLGAGGSLLAACLGDSPHGVSTMGYQGEHKPIDFFKHFGFRDIDQKDGATLLVYGNADVQLQHTYLSTHAKSDRLAADVLFNPECPWSTRTAERVIEQIEKHPARAEIELWVGDCWACGVHLGLLGGVYLNGVQPFTSPPTDAEIARAIENALTVRIPSDT
ncbi:MAG: GNAT family N-acetyltransferase [Chloroflexi bacterium]|nr:GNAT family N-acetyltransferase [Chloroflexota bacterium]